MFLVGRGAWGREEFAVQVVRIVNKLEYSSWKMKAVPVQWVIFASKILQWEEFSDMALSF